MQKSMHVGITNLLRSLILAVLCTGSVAAQQNDSPVSVRFVTDSTAIKAGESFAAGVLFTIKPGWHIYYKNPGETGLPTRVALEFGEGAAAGPVRWPVPVKFTGLGDVLGYGYASELLLPVTVQVSPESGYGRHVSVEGNVQWLACGKTLCVPGKAQLKAGLVPGRPNAQQDPALFARWNERLPKKIGEINEIEKLTSEVERSANRITLKLVVSWKEEITVVRWIPDAIEGVIFGEPQVRLSGEASEITIEAQPVPGSGSIPDSLAGLLTFTTPNGQIRGTAVEFKLH